MGAIPSATPAQAPTNPQLTTRCGLKVMLVLDESNSIFTLNAVGDTREAADTFVTALQDTGSPLAITAFHSFGRPGPPEAPTPGTTNPAGYSEVIAANVSMFRNWIDNVAPANPIGFNPPSSTTGTGFGSVGVAGTPTGTTNWQDAFMQVGRTPGGPPNLVVFVTDGNPNTTNSGPNGSNSLRTFWGENETGWTTALPASVAAAQAVKSNGANGGTGSRIFGIGVGPLVDDSASAQRIAAVTGPSQGTNPITNDYAIVPSFTDLRAELVRIVADLCGSRLIIHKHVANVHGGPWMPGHDWRFTANLTSPGHTWLTPASAGTHNSATLATDSNGRLEFLWRLPEADTTAHLGVIKETVKPGLSFVGAVCATHNIDGDLVTLTVDDMLPIRGATLGREQYRTCNVYNAPEKPGNGGGDSTAPDLVIPADAPHLVVHKKLPAHARVGDRVPITITVKNTGAGTANDVILHENRPGGLRLVAVGNHGSLHNGTAVWHLGNLAPGESRTVHATALVLQTGLHPDTAVAFASNADPAFSNAAVRAAAATRPAPPTPTPSPPSFTG